MSRRFYSNPLSNTFTALFVRFTDSEEFELRMSNERRGCLDPNPSRAKECRRYSHCQTSPVKWYTFVIIDLRPADGVPPLPSLFTTLHHLDVPEVC